MDIDVNIIVGVSSRMRIQITSLYDYVMRTLSFSLDMPVRIDIDIDVGKYLQTMRKGDFVDTLQHTATRSDATTKKERVKRVWPHQKLPQVSDYLQKPGKERAIFHRSPDSKKCF